VPALRSLFHLGALDARQFSVAASATLLAAGALRFMRHRVSGI